MRSLRRLVVAFVIVALAGACQSTDSDDTESAPSTTSTSTVSTEADSSTTESTTTTTASSSSTTSAAEPESESDDDAAAADSESQPEDAADTATGGAEAEIAGRITDFYQAGNEGRWEDFWAFHSEDFQRRCSFQAMVDYQESKDRAGQTYRPYDITVTMASDREAVAIYKVDVTSGETLVRSYDYRLDALLEGDVWVLEEGCY